MKDWLCFSSPDMINWTEHGSPFAAKNFTWAKGNAYASKSIEKNGKFYFYAAVAHATIAGAAIGVAVSDNPVQGYKDAKGSALITHDMLPPTNNEKANLDPTVLIDDDGQVYIIWGNKTLFFKA